VKLNQSHTRRKARIEVIPLIDIMFFLLATFVLVSLSMTENRGLKVNLPGSKVNESADKSGGKSEDKDITLSITKENTIYLDKKQTDLTELDKLLSENKSLVDKNFIVLGDESSKLDLTVQILDLAKKYKVKSIVLRTKVK
jgi:biopolymer transport protein ExbD